ncbi:MAG: GGDEF domain-containing protein [Legionellales bacterium]|nr:GGDEF domain-containing protein [Legionellales bacterium]
MIVDNKTLIRIPLFISLFFILFLGLPVFVLNHFEIDFIRSREPQLYQYLSQLLFQWSLLSLAAVTTFLAFAHFRLTRNLLTLVIGLTLLSSGILFALHPIFLLHPFNIDPESLQAVSWLMIHGISGLILLAGLLYINPEKMSILVLSILWGIIAPATLILFHPQWQSKLSYEIIDLLVYTSVLFILSQKIFKKQQDLFTMCVFYMSLIQIAIALDLGYISHQNMFNLASCLQLTLYFIPLTYFLLYYVFSYAALLEHKKNADSHQDRLSYLATHDMMTNLYNRREFENILSRTIANHERSKTSFALFLIDLDNFKDINDALGHPQGDEYLKLFAQQLTHLTRQGDFISRHGGDEFTVIMSSLESPASARKLANRILNGIKISYTLRKTLKPLTLSIGISIYPGSGKNSEALLKHADIAMYHAKKLGKNTFQVYTKKLSVEALTTS